MPSQNDIARKNLRLFRRQQRLTQQKLAELTNLEPSTIGHYETGRNFIPIDRLEIFAEVFQIPFLNFFIEEQQNIQFHGGNQMRTVNFKQAKGYETVTSSGGSDWLVGKEFIFNENENFFVGLTPEGAFVFAKDKGTDLMDKEAFFNSEEEEEEISICLFWLGREDKLEEHNIQVKDLIGEKNYQIIKEDLLSYMEL